MSETKTTKKRMPDRCPHHPESEAYTSKTDETNMRTDKVTQYQCAEPGCQRPLGWQYNGPSGKFLSGPGTPTPEVEIIMEKRIHEDNTVERVSAAACVASLVFIMVWFLMALNSGHQWSTAHTIFAAIYVPGMVMIIASLARIMHLARPHQSAPEQS